MIARTHSVQHDFGSSADLAVALAETVADRLTSAIKALGGATLAVSGGTTPAEFFEALSHEKLDWTKVIIVPVDERFVPPSSDRSNEKLIRKKLLVNEARLARFVTLYSDAETVDRAARQADAGVALLGQILDVVILGMGTDGHTASFFPDAPNLDELTDPNQIRRVMAVIAPSAGEPRLTLTLPLIAHARFLALHIEGEAKRKVLEKSMSDEQPYLPIRMVLNRAASSPQIYWAPAG